MNNSNVFGGSPSPYSLDKQAIDEILVSLNDLLVGRNRILEITVYGGSSLCLLSKYRDTTYDIDVSSSDDSLLKDCVNELGYPKDLVNTEMSVFINLRETLVLYKEFSNLKVFVPTLDYLLALKLKACRDKDLMDCINLANDLNLVSVEDLKKVFCRFYSVIQFSSHRIKFCESVVRGLDNRS